MEQSGGVDNNSISHNEIQEQSLSAVNLLANNLSNIVYDMKIYTDENGPYINAPEVVKQILNRAKMPTGSLDVNQIDLSTLIFQPKPTQNNFCMYEFKRNQDRYYHCMQCTGATWQPQMIVFCQRCFIPQQHIGHRYFYQDCKKNQCYCDCGSKSKTSSNMKCSHHSEDKIISPIIKEGQQQRFISIFKSLLEVGCYLDDAGDLFEKICQSLYILCQNSVYYCKLTLQLLKLQSQYIRGQTQGLFTNHFISILGWTHDISNITLAICANNILRLQLAKFVFSNFDKFKNHISNFSIGIIFDLNTLEELAQQDYFISGLFEKYVELAKDKNDERGKKLFISLLSYLFKDNINCLIQTNDQYTVRPNRDSVDTIEIAWIYIKKFLQFYPKNKNKKVSTFKKTKKPKKPQLENYVKLINQLIMHSMLVITKSDTTQIQNFRQQLEKQQVNLQNFQFFLMEICYYASVYFFDPMFSSSNQTPINICLVLLLIKKSPKRSQLINFLWLAEIGQHIKFQHITGNIYQLVSAVIWSKYHFAIHQGYINRLTDYQNNQNDEERQKIIQQFFKRFLNSKQIITRNQIIQMRNRKLLEFKQVGKLLRTSCSYSNQDEVFYYSQAAPEPKFVDKFAYFYKETTVSQMQDSMYANKSIYYGFEKNQIIDKDTKQLLHMILNSDILQEIIEDNWKQSQKLENHDPDSKKGYLYLYILIIVSSFGKNQKSAIHGKLAKFNSSPKQLRAFAKSESQFQMIQRLFCIEQQKPLLIRVGFIRQKSQNEKEQIKGQQTVLEQKRKFQQKRKKLSQKFSNKRKNILSAFQSISMDIRLANDEDICMTCHEKNHLDNQLVYLAKIGTNNTLCKAIHNENDKANTTVYTCFHTLHLKCFIQLHQKSRNMSFYCPLCNMNVNCFIPRDIKQENKQVNLVFSNLITSALVSLFKCYDAQSYFILFFKHLVQAKGLNSLVDNIQNWQRNKITDKSDSFIQSHITCAYEKSSQKGKQQYKNLLQNFITQVQNCKSEACKLVQILITKTLKNKILYGPNVQYDLKQIERLKQVLKWEQFLIIKLEIQKIIGYKIQLTFQSIKVPQQQKQALSFNLKQIPRDSTKFKDFIYSNFCHHRKQIDFYCLICGKGICQQCNDQNNQLEHYGVSAYISIQDFIVHFKTSNMEQQKQVYFNDFKIAYSQRGNYNMENQLYTLNNLELTAIIQQFMQQ